MREKILYSTHTLIDVVGSFQIGVTAYAFCERPSAEAIENKGPRHEMGLCCSRPLRGVATARVHQV